MKHLIPTLLIAEILLCTFCAFAQNDPVGSRVSISGDTITVEIKNISADTIYVFDSYFKDERNTTSPSGGIVIKVDCPLSPLAAKHLYRYDKSTGCYKISLLPFIPYLCFNITDCIIIAPHRIARHSQVKYSFMSLAPQKSFEIKIPTYFLPSGKWIKDFDVKKYDLNAYNIKFANSRNKFPGLENSKLVMEICVYNDISNLDMETYYNNAYLFNEKIKDFNIVRIPINF